MTLGTQDGAGPGRTRDAANTRRLLLEAARRRFAHDGYASTTSRDVAADVGVNVALVNRYFGSKEGLFEACLARTVEQLDPPPRSARTLDELVRTLIEQVAPQAGGTRPLQLLLLLRTSGDERVDEIRRRTMRSYTERMAAIAGWREDDPSTAPLLLRAQMAMAMGFGIVLMRASSALEPMSTADEAQLAEPLGEVLRTLLPGTPDPLS